MDNNFRPDVWNFEYNKKYTLPGEHRWCFLIDDEKRKKFLAEREKMGEMRFIRRRVQSDSDIVGQMGPIK